MRVNDFEERERMMKSAMRQYKGREIMMCDKGKEKKVRYKAREKDKKEYMGHDKKGKGSYKPRAWKINDLGKEIEKNHDKYESREWRVMNGMRQGKNKERIIMNQEKGRGRMVWDKRKKEIR